MAKKSKPWFQTKKQRETRNYLLEAQKSIKGFQLPSTFSYFHFCCQWLFQFLHFSLLGVPVGIASSAEGQASQLLRKKKNKIIMSCYLQNLKLNTVEDLISKALSNLYINHDEFISVNVLKECNEMKKKIFCVICKKNAAKKNSSVRQNKQN